VVADAAATQNSVLASRLMKWTRKIPKLVLGTDSALLAQMLEHDLLQWEFDTEEIQRLSGGHALLAIGWALFERHDLRAKLDLRTDAVLDFLANVEVGYKAVPYHNSVHAADVTHALHWLLSSYALGKFVKDDPLLLFTVLVSAITHDLGHDGYYNAFHVNSNSDIAVGSCYSAPLERYHLSSAFALLSKERSILSGLGLHERKQVQTWMREIVLATDFGVHMDIINEYRACLDLRGVVGGEDGAPLATGSAVVFEGDEKILMLKLAIKTADLGYLTKGKKVAFAWTDLVLHEFFTQGDTEKRLSLPVSFGCDRDTIDVPQSQLGFYQFMVKPLYEAMDLLVPMGMQMANLEEMRKHWQQKKDEMK